ncbi:nuclease-related domain-containing DEAD/DEAH box helicase [Caballeronia glebae]|uniref:nuclease-related domain-containing DEAD/DEAH box helicase n=1 Tax=Caballeronia glebae TaxID=1777143 RepID=UPI0038BB30D0
MAQVFPAFENIDRLKVKPTPGEFALLDTLATRLDDDTEVYFQPMLNGDMPDIIMMKKGHGVAVIEVKDWNLSAYRVDERGDWFEQSGKNRVRSPFQQAFRYKTNLFDLHINGLVEKTILNKVFYGVVGVFVYFHGSAKGAIDAIFSVPETVIAQKRKSLNEEYREGRIRFADYERQMEHLDRRATKISRDRRMSIHAQSLAKLSAALVRKNPLFDDAIYNEFRRYLSPPVHVARQGIEIQYDATQSKYIESRAGFQKIKGVAGSGKTTVLAKRAVNAHKRHGDNVLILTFNKTLRNTIRDKISDVREDFPWGAFQISNYHSFISQTMNTCGMALDVPSDPEGRKRYFEQIYADENLFDGYDAMITRYATILVDEIQDYEPGWIKIVCKYFLREDGEMALFGDDSQNIYAVNVERRESAMVLGFGPWQKFRKSYRAKSEALTTRLARKFQDEYLVRKYGSDVTEVAPSQGALSLELLSGHELDHTNESAYAKQVFERALHFIRKQDIHPNDVCIISSGITLLREIDFLIRKERNESTQITFEKEEEFVALQEQSGLNQKEIDDRLETLRGVRKLFFEQNSGLMKLSTVHSFKGMEAHTIIFIPMPNDSDEIIYTGITRARQNLLMLFPKDVAYLSFFKENMSFT